MVTSRRRNSRLWRLASLTGAAALVMAACGGSGSGSAASTSTVSKASEPTHHYPNSIVVIGHSGATGYNSDPTAPKADAKQNSWATGDNPEVDSIYTRLLAVNGAARGHNVNVAVDGTGVNELAGQVDRVHPLVAVLDEPGAEFLDVERLAGAEHAGPGLQRRPLRDRLHERLHGRQH